MPPPPPPEVFAFAVDPSLQPFAVAPRRWLAQHDKHYAGILAAAVVFDDAGRVLLVQRAAHDSMPNLWEVPGGAADDGDDDDDDDDDGAANSRTSILAGAARELWEEAGLVATRFTHLVAQPAEAPAPGATAAPAAAHPEHGGFVFLNRSGTATVLRLTFHATVRRGDAVVLDPGEHQAYVWATEDEVRAGVTGSGQAIPATMPATRAVVLEAFRQRAAHGPQPR